MATTRLFNHLKLRKLCALLNAPRPHAVGYLECLCNYVAQHRPTGDLTGCADDDVALMAEYVGDLAAFVPAAISAGFIDRDGDGQRLHDWPDWCPSFVLRRLGRDLGVSQSRTEIAAALAQQRRSTGAPPVRQRRATGAAVPQQWRAGGTATAQQCRSTAVPDKDKDKDRDKEKDSPPPGGGNHSTTKAGGGDALISLLVTNGVRKSKAAQLAARDGVTLDIAEAVCAQFDHAGAIANALGSDTEIAAVRQRLDDEQREAADVKRELSARKKPKRRKKGTGDKA